MPVKRVREQPFRRLLRSSIRWLGGKVLGKRIKEPRHALFESGCVIARRGVLRLRPREFRATFDHPGANTFEPGPDPLGRAAIIFVVVFDRSAGIFCQIRHTCGQFQLVFDEMTCLICFGEWHPSAIFAELLNLLE